MGKKKLSNTKGSHVIMLRSDYDLLVKVYNILLDSELSEEELSFLLGKPDVYFFSLLNPAQKTKLKSELIPLLVPIFKKGIASILLKDDECFPDEQVSIKATAKFNNKSSVYKHTVTYKNQTESAVIEWKKKVEKGGRNVENKSLTEYFKGLITDGYFLKPRTSLHFHINLPDNFDGPFTPLDIQVSFAKLMRKQGGVRPLLQLNSDNSRFYYSENYFIEAFKDVEVLKELVRADSNKLELPGCGNIELTDVLSYYTIASLDKVVLGFIGIDGRNLKAIYIFEEYRHMRLGSRLIDFVVKLGKKDNPLIAVVPVNSEVVGFLETSVMIESKEDRKYRKENKLKVKRLVRGK